MKYQFHVNLSEEDLFDYNLFMETKAKLAKMRVRNMRLVYWALALFNFGLQAYLMIFYGAPLDGLLLMLGLLMMAVAICAPTCLKWQVKRRMATMKKAGETPFSPSSVLTFYEDHVEEVLPEGRIEGSYAAIMWINFNGNRAMYLHANDLGVFFLPTACFTSPQQRESFLAFLQEKCPGATRYYA